MASRDYPEIVFPCPRPPAMGRDQRTLWCDACGKQVHNLSALSPCAQEALLRANPTACVSYRRPLRAAPMAATAALALALAGSQPLAAQTDANTEPPPPPEAEPEQMLMGAIALPRPELESVFLEAEPVDEPEGLDPQAEQAG